MKSEKAKEYIDKEILRMDNDRLKDCYGYNEERDGISYLEIDEVRKAVEIAEQEAEERMRQKAIKAFKNLCFHRDNDKCSISYGINDDGDYNAGQKCDEYCKHCTTLKNFIQKLTEE
ncbi:hypothetical protein [Alistipes sp.]|uniref:hypothetical protein n=1 Tax=Alistipes sp. TaxID=1872444 RepID=UPI003AB47F0B